MKAKLDKTYPQPHLMGMKDWLPIAYMVVMFGLCMVLVLAQMFGDMFNQKVFKKNKIRAKS